MTDDDTKKIQKPKVSRSRNTRVVVLVNDEETDAFVAASAQLGLTVATWLRMLGRKASGLPTLGE